MSRRIGTILGLMIAAGIGFAVGRAAPGPSGGRLSADEMKSQLAQTLETPSLNARLSRLVDLTRRFDAENVAGAGAALAERVSSADNDDIRLILAAWSELDPRAAFESVMTWPLESKRVVGAGVVAYEWSLRGGALEVREFVRGMHQYAPRSAAMRGLVQGWSQSGDLDGLTDYVANEAQIGVREQLTEILVNSLLVSGGVEAVIRWADSVPADAKNGYKHTAFKKALRQVANRDPEAGARWYAGQSAQDWARRSIPVIAGEWAEHDPPAALAWLLQQPEGMERDVGLNRWITRFTITDHPGALDWMEKADLTGPLASLPARFVGALLPDHPADAERWAGRIEDPDLRARALREVERARRMLGPSAPQPSPAPTDEAAGDAGQATASPSAASGGATGNVRDGATSASGAVAEEKASS